VILVVDNYDSFTYNLVQALADLGGVRVEVVRNDQATADALLECRPQAIVISPGPGIPEQAGISIELIASATDVPLLGICLGHQALAAAHGAKIIRGPEPVHGKTSPIHHSGVGLFEGVPNPFEATRYHSLVVERESVPDVLEVTAATDDGQIMALKHRDRPHYGLQFHPESYLCREGPRLLARFLEYAGLSAAAPGGHP
jgi:anthranilate synthase/aminodeoxychorismate synthase-like glutamine amidotransferase